MFKGIIGGLFGQTTNRDIDTLVRTYTEQRKFSGSVLVARNGAILLSKGYGIANLEHDIPNVSETVFRIGSMTKPFTAIAIMQLAEAGQLSVNDRLDKYLPDFPNAERITIHQLLSNTSGIPDYIITPGYQKIATQHISTEALIGLFRDLPLQFEPGTNFGYSNSGWVLLGAILEKLTGKSYGQVIKDNIFTLAGMTHSGYEWEQPVIRYRSTGHVDTGAGMINAEVLDETSMQGAGGLYSTVEDLYRWHLALGNNTLIHAETLAQMIIPVAPEYGYGWERHTYYGRAAFGHSGGLPGYVSNFVRFADEDAVIIIVSNLGSASVPQITNSLAAILFGQPYTLPSAYTFVSVAPAILADYIGEYEVTYFGRKSILCFALEGDKLSMSVMGLPKAILSPLSDTKFYARSKGDVEMTFRREGNTVNAIDMVWAGHPQTATRVK